MASREAVMNIPLDEIVVSEGRRPIDADAVRRLAKSIKEVGLQHPITVRSVKGQFLLIAGGHRLEAYRRNSETTVPATVVKMEDDEARMWEIAENLHRFEYPTKLDRDNAIAEWTALKAERISRQNCRENRGRPEGAASYASEELGLELRDVQRAVRVGGLTDEAKAEAKDLGLDDNRSVLLAAKSEDKNAEQEVAFLRTEHARREAEKARKEAEKLNKDTDRVIQMTDAERLAEWILARSDLEELPTLLSWIDNCKPKDIGAAIRRGAA